MSHRERWIVGGGGGGDRKDSVFHMVVLSIVIQTGICFALNLSFSKRILIYSSPVKFRKTMDHDVTDSFAARSGLAHDVTSRTLRFSSDEQIFLVQDGNLRALVTGRSLFLLP